MRYSLEICFYNELIYVVFTPTSKSARPRKKMSGNCLQSRTKFWTNPSFFCGLQCTFSVFPQASSEVNEDEWRVGSYLFTQLYIFVSTDFFIQPYTFTSRDFFAQLYIFTCVDFFTQQYIFVSMDFFTILYIQYLWSLTSLPTVYVCEHGLLYSTVNICEHGLLYPTVNICEHGILHQLKTNSEKWEL